MLSEFTEEQKIKIKPYTNKPPKTEGQLKQYIGADAFKLLRTNKMIIEKLEKGKKSKFKFSEEAIQIFSKVETPKKTRRKSKPKTSVLDIQNLEPLIQKLISPRFDILEKRISNLEKFVKSNEVEISPSTRPFIPTMAEFTLHLKRQWQKLDRVYRWGGRVEIPLLRENMKNIPRDTFDNYLLELEKTGVIDLQVASDPFVISRSEDGIKHPVRGLIYYLIFRN